MSKVLLYSGGLDSWLINKLWKPDKRIYIDLHGAYNEAEKMRLPADVEILDFPLLGTWEQPDKFIPLRNLYFLMIASNYGDTICLGATGGDWGNKDKTPEFLNESEHLIQELLSDKKIKKSITIEKSFIYRYKNELLHEYLNNGGNIQEVKESTFSCYTPINNNECLECYPCFRKFALLYANGCSYSQEEKEKMWQYVKTTIIPTKDEGGYPGTYYTDRGNESTDLIKAVQQLKEEFS